MKIGGKSNIIKKSFYGKTGKRENGKTRQGKTEKTNQVKNQTKYWFKKYFSILIDIHKFIFHIRQRNCFFVLVLCLFDFLLDRKKLQTSFVVNSKMDVIDFDSDSDLENAIIEHEFLQKSRAPRKFRKRKFSEDVSDIEFRQRYRLSREVINYLTDRLTHLLQRPTK